MGDISQILPAVHAYFAIVPEPIANHTVEFATELLAEPSLVAHAKADFDRQLAAGEVAGRKTWLARGREYTGAGTTAE